MLYHTAEIYIPETDDYINVTIEFRIYEVGYQFADDVEWEYNQDRPQYEIDTIEKYIDDNFDKIMDDLDDQMRDI
jgi:hypothetical protein